VLQTHIDSLEATADLRSVFPALQPRLQSARALYLGAVRSAERVLTPEQWSQLPEWVRTPALGGRRPGNSEPRQRGGSPP
jgi:hypothetical protein